MQTYVVADADVNTHGFGTKIPVQVSNASVGWRETKHNFMRLLTGGT
jgi:hypothetical protein